MSHDTNEQFLYIVGVGRSGTSLLQAMLNAHPHVCFPPETAFLRRFVARRRLDQLFIKGGARAVADHLKQDRLVSRLNLTESEIDELVERYEDKRSSSKIYWQTLQTYARKQNGVRWIGDKDPRSIEYLRVIARHFPNALVLHIIRDPRDVLNSKKRAKWSSGRPTWQYVFANRVQIKMARSDGPALFGGRYIEISYEELLARPGEVLESLCERMALSFDDRMLEFARTGRQIVAEDELAWKKEVLGPLLQDNVGKWKDALSAWEVELTERACSALFGEGRYPREPRTGDLGLIGRLSCALTCLVVSALDPLYRGWRRCQHR